MRPCRQRLSLGNRNLLVPPCRDPGARLRRTVRGRAVACRCGGWHLRFLLSRWCSLLFLLRLFLCLGLWRWWRLRCWLLRGRGFLLCRGRRGRCRTLQPGKLALQPVKLPCRALKLLDARTEGPASQSSPPSHCCHRHKTQITTDDTAQCGNGNELSQTEQRWQLLNNGSPRKRTFLSNPNTTSSSFAARVIKRAGRAATAARRGATIGRAVQRLADRTLILPVSAALSRA